MGGGTSKNKKESEASHARRSPAVGNSHVENGGAHQQSRSHIDSENEQLDGNQHHHKNNHHHDHHDHHDHHKSKAM